MPVWLQTDICCRRGSRSVTSLKPEASSRFARLPGSGHRSNSKRGPFRSRTRGPRAILYPQGKLCLSPCSTGRRREFSCRPYLYLYRLSSVSAARISASFCSNASPSRSVSTTSAILGSATTFNDMVAAEPLREVLIEAVRHWQNVDRAPRGLAAVGHAVRAIKAIAARVFITITVYRVYGDHPRS